MQELLKKIETHAAERLVVPPGRRASEEMPRFKTFLKVETHRLKLAHNAGQDGRFVCTAHSAVIAPPIPIATATSCSRANCVP